MQALRVHLPDGKDRRAASDTGDRAEAAEGGIDLLLGARNVVIEPVEDGRDRGMTSLSGQSRCPNNLSAEPANRG